MNLPSKVEEHSVSLESNFSWPRLYRGTEGNFFILFGSFTGACGQDVHVLQLRGQPLAKFPCLMETRWKLESQFSATEVRLDGTSEFKRHNPLFFPSPLPHFSFQNPRVNFRDTAFSLCVCPESFFFFLNL